MIEGYLPREQPDIETCLERKDFMESYIVSVPDLPELEGIYCLTRTELQKKFAILI
jgi:hypothetical protein